MSDNNSFSILVVDDEPAVRQVFCRFLELRGHDVTACGSAEEALQLAKQHEFKVIVCDLLLPDANGLELAAQLRRVPTQAAIIMLTGKPSEEAAKRARELKIHSFIAKPIRAAALIEVVEEAARH